MNGKWGGNMVTEADPITGNWYQHLDKGQRFLVVAVDEENGLIEVQYFDGNLDEIELSEWRQMELEPIEETENWSGALDIGELDDLGTSVTDTNPNDWQESLQEIKGPDAQNPSDKFKETQDDWDEGFPKEELWVEQ